MQRHSGSRQGCREISVFSQFQLVLNASRQEVRVIDSIIRRQDYCHLASLHVSPELYDHCILGCQLTIARNRHTLNANTYRKHQP